MHVKKGFKETLALAVLIMQEFGEWNVPVSDIYAENLNSNALSRPAVPLVKQKELLPHWGQLHGQSVSSWNMHEYLLWDEPGMKPNWKHLKSCPRGQSQKGTGPWWRPFLQRTKGKARVAATEGKGQATSWTHNPWVLGRNTVNKCPTVSEMAGSSSESTG